MIEGKFLGHLPINLNAQVDPRDSFLDCYLPFSLLQWQIGTVFLQQTTRSKNPKMYYSTSCILTFRLWRSEMFCDAPPPQMPLSSLTPLTPLSLLFVGLARPLQQIHVICQASNLLPAPNPTFLTISIQGVYGAEKGQITEVFWGSRSTCFRKMPGANFSIEDLRWEKAEREKLCPTRVG